MMSPLGGSRSPPAPEMEMHDPAGLLEIAAFVAILRNSPVPIMFERRACALEQVHGFYCTIAGGKPRQCYVRFGSKAPCATQKPMSAKADSGHPRRCEREERPPSAVS